ncbi:MAG: hypothetical protein M1834_006744 [Cirrosporium novae-zelandiae]|nr:MAG: hypothetical protein M1834_006744 [Cirrosporium novae-zelandiae]
MSESNVIEFDRRGDVKLRIGGSADETTSKVFIVCSRALARVSPVFDRMLYGGFAESKPRGATNPDDWVVDLPEDRPGPLALLLHIAHCQVSRVPKVLSIDKLYELTVLTHYYDATQILLPWLDPWVASVHEMVQDADTLMPKFLWITWELGYNELFEATARRMLMEAPASILAPDSPLQSLQMPPDTIERITAIRMQTIQALLDVFRDLVDKLLVADENPRWCRYASFMGPHRCESMILGSMTFCLTRAGLWPLPESADVEDSIVQLHTKLTNLVIHDIGRSSEKGAVNHSECNPQPYLVEDIQRIMDEIPDPVTDFHRKHIKEQVRKIST